MFLKGFFLASTLLYGADALFGSTKNVTVIGRLFCGYWPMKDVIIELWEDDTLFGIGRNDMLNVTTTDDNGRFMVYGQDTEFFGIEPYVLIKHRCTKKYCDTTDRRDISKRYLGRTYDIGSVELGAGRRRLKKLCH